MAKFSITGMLGIDAKGAREELGKFTKPGGALGKLSPAFKAVGKAAAAAFAVAAAAVAAFAVSSTKKMMEFQKGMAEVFTLLPGKSKQFKDSFKKDLLELGTQYGKLTDETVPALYQALSAGVPEKNVMSFLGKASELSIGGVMDLKESVGLLSGVTNAFGDRAGSAAEIADTLFTTIKVGTTTGAELAASLGDVLPIAGALGIDFKELNAMLAQSTSITGNTSKSMTGLKGMLAELGKTGMQANKMFKAASGQEFPAFIKAGGSVTDALRVMDKHATANGISLLDMFGNLEGGQAALQIATDGFAGMDGKMKEFVNTTGASGEATKEMAATFEMAWKKMQARIEKFQIMIGDMLTPILEAVSPIIDDIFTMIEKLPWDEMAHDIKDLGYEITEAFSGSGKEAISDFVKLGFSFVKTLVQMAKAVVMVYKGLADIGVFKALNAVLKVLLGFIDAIILGWQKMGEAFSFIAAGFRGENKKWGESIDDVTEKEQERANKIAELNREKYKRQKHEEQRARNVRDIEAAAAMGSEEGMKALQKFLGYQGFKMTISEMIEASQSGKMAEMVGPIGNSLAKVATAIAELQGKEVTEGVAKVKKGQQMLTAMGLTPNMVRAMKEATMKGESFKKFYEVVAAGIFTIPEMLEKSFGKTQAQRILAMGAKFAEQQKFLADLQAKSLKELAKAMGMSEKEMIDNFHRGRLGGPVRNIIGRKLKERDELERKLMGTSKRDIELQKAKEKRDAKIAAEEEKRAEAAKKEQSKLWEKMNREAKTAQESGPSIDELLKQQMELTKGQKEATQATREIPKGIEKVRKGVSQGAKETIASLEEITFPECIALCDETIEKLGAIFKGEGEEAEKFQKKEKFTDTTGMNPSVKYAIAQRDKKLNIYLDAQGKPLTGKALEDAQAQALSKSQSLRAMEKMAQQASTAGSIYVRDDAVLAAIATRPIVSTNRLATNFKGCCKAVHNIDRNISAIEKRLRGCISNQ